MTVVADAPPGTRTPDGDSGRTLVRGTRWLSVATLSVGLLNYVYSLGLTRLLGVADYAVFAAGQALLLSAGTVATASVPWVLAQALARAGSVAERREAVWFALVVNGVLGLAAGLVAAAVSTQFAPPGVAGVVGLATALVVLASTTAGWVQGSQRFGLLAVLRVSEVVVKIAAGVLLVAAGAGAGGALGGFAAGSVLLLVAGALLMRSHVRPSRLALRRPELWRSAGGVAGVQGLVALLITVDVVLVAVLVADAAAAASYQAAMVLARVPLFLAGAVSMAVFPLVARGGPQAAALVRRSCGLYAALVVPYAIALATVPGVVLAPVFPPEYAQVDVVLPWAAVAGALMGTVQLLTTFFQAAGAYRPSMRAQVVGLVVHLVAVVAGGLVGGALGLAVGTVLGAALSVVLLALASRPLWGRAVGLTAGAWVLSLALLAALVLLRPVPVAWLLAAAVVGLTCAWRALAGLQGRPQAGPATTADDGSGRRLRVLHLGFEDWRKPGSGGGAVRTREVNRRLAQRHDITVLTTSYRGARERVEDGVRYVPVGLPLGYTAGILTYFAALPLVARRYPADLVVEDFAAPFGSALPHRWTRRPLLALVQWMNAEEKAEQYHLPVHRVQRRGVLGHRRFVVMTEDLGDKVRATNPDAVVDVVPNGVPAESFDVEVPRGDDVVALGRLENAQKGFDLLLDAWARIEHDVPGRLVLAGDGPDAAALRARTRRLGLEDRVRFAGRVDGTAKLELLAAARVVAVPSRFETFGLVAAEALACGTPVVAFEIPCLREVVAPGCGVLVPSFDVAALAGALLAVVQDPARGEEMGRRGREHARRYDWDDVALAQEQAYLRAVEVAR